MFYALSAFIGYLLGSICMSIIISKYVLKDDVRNHGSHNAGATNVARVFGWVPGIITFLCDFLKCFLSMLVGQYLCGEWGVFAAVAACLLGHCFPVFFGFRGGKAVSTGACVALLIDWRIFVLVLIIFFVVASITKIVSISSVTAAVGIMVLSFVLSRSLPMQILGVFTGLLIIFMHRSNLKRLIHGEEGKFHAKT